MEWILSDDASKQHVCKVSDMEYRLIEMSLCNPETEQYMVYTDYIDLDDYLEDDGNADEELTSIISGFGYTSTDHIRNEYGQEANQVMCECVFESLSSFEGTTLFTGTEAECEAFITDYISRQ